MSKVTQLTDPVTKEKAYPVTTTDCVYLPNGESLTKHLNKSGLPLGLIIPSAIVQNDAGLRLLDGSNLALDGMYKAFCDYLVEIHLADKSTVPVYYTIQEYANDMNDFGQCGKFVYNPRSSALTSTPRNSADLVYTVPANSLKLPTITKHIEGLTDISQLGTALGAGLPNIEGSVNSKTGIAPIFVPGTTASGAFTINNTSSDTYHNTGKSNDTRPMALTIDASKSNSIYGNSDTVQTQSVKYPYYIVVATTTKTDIEVDIDNIASDLNNALNQINTKISKNEIARYPVSTWISSDKSSWYIIYNDGWKECGGHVVLSATNNWQQPTVIFPIPFDIAPISLLINVKLTTYQDAAMYGQITSYSNTQFVTGVYSATGRNEFFWSACGY